MFNRPLENIADYLSYFDCPTNEANPMLDPLFDEAWLNAYASEYRPFLIEQLLCSLSPGLTYTYLSGLNYPLFDNRIFKDALINIRINLNDYFKAESLHLSHALAHLDKIIKNIPPVINLHIAHLNKLSSLFQKDQTARNKFNEWLINNNCHDTHSTLACPVLLRSIADIDTLLSVSLAKYHQAQSAFTIKKKKPLHFLHTLINHEIKTCELLQVQIEALQCILTEPATSALEALKQAKETFDNITRLPEMNMEIGILRFATTHKNQELLIKLRDHALLVLNMENEWHQVMVQDAFLNTLPETYKTHPSYRLTWEAPYQRTILQGMFNHTLPTDKAGFRERIQGLVGSLNTRINTLSRQNDLAPNTPLPPLPLLSVTTLLMEDPDRIYLPDQPDVCLNELELMLSGDAFVALNTELVSIPSLSAKETAAVMFEINLLILLKKFSDDIHHFCETVALPYLSEKRNTEPLSLPTARQWKNQQHYFSALSVALLEQLACLRTTCQNYLVRARSPLQWPQLERILNRLMVLDNSARQHAFILASFKARLIQHAVVQDAGLHRDLLDQANYHLDQGQPFDATEYLNQFYRDTQAFEQNETVQARLSELEERVIKQLATLLHQTHRLLFLSTPLEILFEADSHRNSHIFIQSLNTYTEKLTLLVEYSLLDEKHTVWSRSKTYARWLRVADQLYTRSDFLGYMAITVGLETLTGLKSAITCLDDQATDLFKHHVKLHKNCMTSVYNSLTQDNVAAIPHLEHFLASISRLSAISGERGSVGYLKKKDARLYRGYDAQVIYRLYQVYHQSLLQELDQLNCPMSDSQGYLDRVDASPISNNHEIRAKTRVIENEDKISISALPQRRTLRRHTSWTEQERDTTIQRHLAEQIRQDRQLTDSTDERENSIFAKNRYIHLTALADTPHGLAEKLTIHSALPIRLDAYRLNLFSHLTALQALFMLLREDRFHSIREIDLHENSADSLAENEAALKRLPERIASYEKIDLGGNCITNALFDGFRKRFSSLRSDDIRLQKLSLQNNKLGIGSYGPAGFYLGIFISGYSHLTHLDLNQNFLSQRDAEPLARALGSSTALREIDLGMNPWGDTSIQILCNTFSLLTSLEVVKFFCCKLTDSSRDTIAALINENRTIIRVIFDGNDRDTYRLNQTSLHNPENQTIYDNDYTGMSATSCMYLRSLLTIKQDCILEETGFSI